MRWKAIKLKPMIKITTELKEGNTPSQIIATAAEGGFDLIILGHLGIAKSKNSFLVAQANE